jgi:outer membrane protein OmpA-like peptidoglycan-associated protein
MRVRSLASRLTFSLAVPFLLSSGCASTPKPKEIVALEDLRSDPTLSEPDRRAFDLLAAADALLVEASRAWEHHDAYAARRDALMGQIKMKTALALMQAERLGSHVRELDAELAISNDEAGRLESELLTEKEEVALLERLQSMKAATLAERKALSAEADASKKQVAAEKRKADALHGLRVLELTLKIAETVDAPTYAKAEYTAAVGMLQDAHKYFDGGHWDEAAARATLAQAEAEKGIALARPKYEKATHALSNRARDRELEADATAIDGVETRLERDGDLQRLVLVLRGLFGDKRAALRPEQAKTVDAVRDLLNKYPTYPLQLTGFTDEQAKADAGKVELGKVDPAKADARKADPGKADDQAALSLARANAVYWALVGRGIDPKRISVEGKSARGSGSRVELSILYHRGD